MLRSIFVLLFKLKGWKLDPNLPKEINRCVMTGVPHTSNWDFVFTVASLHMLGVPLRFTIKKEWMKAPFKWLIGPLGAIAIDRSPRGKDQQRPSMVQVMAELFDTHEQLALVVTPEGTRKRRTQWKTGFYHTAVQAGVPIVLAYLDYENKQAGAGKVIYPSGDMDKDMRDIMDYYREAAKPKFPELFSLDERYV